MGSNLSMDEVLLEFHEFTGSKKSVVLGTVGGDGSPEASYAPVLKLNNRFYIYVSELSKHTENLLNHLQASLLFIEDEMKSKQIFARQRATIKTHVKEIQRGKEAWEKILDAMQGKHGGLIEMLKPLDDFHLFEITPIEASYVRGFAQAYKVTGTNLSEITHKNDRGHGSKQ
ncbi:pyridoxamine 5'-phosphate oxidase family protein [Thiomicrorhabdus sp. 6S2-11]|uniref:Pyridoxamine 5'-phosphate oxidase family protein n=1 Tax=Thiomicrorhabdus marina TaxID=2818442 RepID=A0ABS3Q402_9GAMM|nr:pyridoxamine 5'-phosphate oxidase family protein [Thiomicrorhabdus marina]